MRVNGLARLLVLEKISDADERTTYLDGRRGLRSRPNKRSALGNARSKPNS